MIELDECQCKLRRKEKEKKGKKTTKSILKKKAYIKRVKALKKQSYKFSYK
jgi:hypothetical protein